MNEPRNEPLYSEWVLPNWTSFLPILLIFPTFWLTFLPINELVGVVSGAVVSVLTVLAMIAKSARVTITDESLKVRNAQIERKFISGVAEVDAEHAFYERGNGLDFRAWVHFQGSVKTLVKVSISDPEDPTPYWLFSTRKPSEIKKSLGF